MPALYKNGINYTGNEMPKAEYVQFNDDISHINKDNVQDAIDETIVLINENKNNISALSDDLDALSDDIADEIDNINTNKADKNTTYTKTEVDDLIPDISGKLDNDGNADNLVISSYTDKDVDGTGQTQSVTYEDIILKTLFSKISDIIFDLRKGLRSKLGSTSSITDTTVTYTEKNISGQFIEENIVTKTIKDIIERLQDKILGNTTEIKNKADKTTTYTKDETDEVIRQKTWDMATQTQLVGIENEVAEQLGAVNSNLTSIGSYNGKSKTGYYANSTGNYVGSDTHGVCIDDIVPCSQGDVVEIQTDVTVGSANIIFLKADKSFLSSTGDMRNAPYSATVPSNAAYFICGVYNGDVSNLSANIYLRKNNVLINNASVGVYTLNESLANQTVMPLELGDLSWNSGSELSSTTWKRSGFVKVLPNTRYVFERTSNGTFNVMAYDENKKAITDGSISGKPNGLYTGSDKVIEVITTATTEYIRIAIANNDISEKITISNIGVGNSVVELTEKVGQLKSDLNGFKLKSGKFRYNVTQTNTGVTMTDDGKYDGTFPTIDTNTPIFFTVHGASTNSTHKTHVYTDGASIKINTDVAQRYSIGWLTLS